MNNVWGIEAVLGYLVPGPGRLGQLCGSPCVCGGPDVKA